jgi:hypothetical protein
MPFHLHFSTNQAGGGDITKVFNQLKQYESFQVPRAWVTSDQVDVRELEVYNFITYRLIDEGQIEEAYYHSIRMALIVQSMGYEANELYLELTMWRRLPCAMALRLGNQSWIGKLGLDIMQMIIAFI